jgi:sugar-specific transcriptional regulator TrmB
VKFGQRLVGRIGVGQEKKTNKSIPMEVTMDDGSTNRNVEAVLDKWKQSFEELLNPVCLTVPGEAPQVEAIEQNDEDILNREISSDEVEDAIQAMKLNKAAGADDLPAELFKDNALIGIFMYYLTHFFKQV